MIVSRFLLATTLVVLASSARAQSATPLPPQTNLVGVSGAPTVTSENFTIASAEDLVVTLTDLQIPAAMSSATVVLTQGAAIVGSAPPTSGSASIAPPATSATLSLAGAVGQYTLRVFGTPNASYNIGTFTVCVAPKSSPTSCIASASLTGSITAPSTASNTNVTTVSETLTVTTAGNYTVTYADDAFPVALAMAPQVALFQAGAAVGPTPLPSGTVVALNPGTYTLLAVATADSTVQQGLFGIVIVGPAGTSSLLSKSYAVGSLNAAAQTSSSATQTLSLKVTDFSFPSALASASAVVTSGGLVIGTAATSTAAANLGSVPPEPLSVWTYASAGTGAGTYEVDLSAGSTSVFQTSGAVSEGGTQAFAFPTSTQSGGTLEAGSYQAVATDFNFPSTLSSLDFAVAQNGAILAQSTQVGPLKFTAAAGQVILLVAATPPTSGNGLLDINVQNSAGTLLFDQTQAVGASALFYSQTICVGGTAGQACPAAGSSKTTANYTVTLTDLMFPSAFGNLAMAVSSGGTVLGQIFGGGNFSFPAAPGSYLLTFVATPSAQQQFGMYGVEAVYAAPTVTLTASPTSVTDGESTTLSWTTTNATSCTGSGGAFAGNQAPGTGSASVVVSASTTYTLACTGPGGSSSASAAVTGSAAPPHSGGGGGGSLDPRLLGVLGFLVGLRSLRRARH
jgi:hypothetical protein